MILSDLLDQLVAQRDRLQAAIDALEALEQDADPSPGAMAARPRHQNGKGKPARGRPGPKKKPAGIHRPPKKGIQRRAAWDVAEAKKLYEAGRPVELIARAVKGSVAAVYERASDEKWKRRRVAARVDTTQRVCEGCHQPSTTNPCHCGHIHR